MSEVKRLSLDLEYPFQYREDAEGNLCYYADYATLKAERDALVIEVANTREQAEHVYAAGYNHGHLNTVDGIAYAPGIKDEFYHNALQVMLEAETPATDAYLNSVRAEGAALVPPEADGSNLPFAANGWNACRAAMLRNIEEAK